MLGGFAHMTQQEMDIQEWKNPDNWSDGFFKAYFSKKDSRIFVPSRFYQKLGMNPHFGNFGGSAINLGHPRGAMWSAILWLMICVTLLVVGLVGNYLEH